MLTHPAVDDANSPELRIQQVHLPQALRVDHHCVEPVFEVHSMQSMQKQQEEQRIVLAGAGVVFYPSSINSSVQLSAYNARGAVSQIPAVLLLQPPTSTASSQASLHQHCCSVKYTIISTSW